MHRIIIPGDSCHDIISALAAESSICVAVEVRMRTLDRFFEIGFSTYSDITGLRLSLYHALEQINAFTTELQSIEVGKARLVCLLREFMNINEASKMATRDVAQRKLHRFLAVSSVTSEVLSTLVS